MGGQNRDAHQVAILAVFGQDLEGPGRHRLKHGLFAAFVMDDGHPEPPKGQVRPQMSDTEIFNMGIVDEHGMFHNPVMYQKPQNFSSRMMDGFRGDAAASANDVNARVPDFFHALSEQGIALWINH